MTTTAALTHTDQIPAAAGVQFAKFPGFPSCISFHPGWIRERAQAILDSYPEDGVEIMFGRSANGTSVCIRPTLFGAIRVGDPRFYQRKTGGQAECEAYAAANPGHVVVVLRRFHEALDRRQGSRTLARGSDLRGAALEAASHGPPA